MNDLLILLKYSTKGRSPWGFTFVPAEQALLDHRAATVKTIIGLVCGSDGVAAFTYEVFRSVAAPRESAVHIACYRNNGQHYRVRDDNTDRVSGVLFSTKIPPLRNPEPPPAEQRWGTPGPT